MIPPHPGPLNLLVIADVHFTAHARHVCGIAERRTTLGRILVRKALFRMAAEGVTPDAIVLLGDLVDNGEAPGAASDLRALAEDLLQSGIPTYAVAGNHDGDPALVAKAFGTSPGLHQIGDYGLLLFQDDPVEDLVYARPAEALGLPESVAAEHPDLILIALQHYPLHPQIEAAYPFMLQNAEQVMAGYRRAGVALSLSGHYHRGQAAHAVDGTVYATAPALAQAPFSFLHVRLEGRTPTVRTHVLRLETPGLWDFHCHTAFAYCATTVEAGMALQLSEPLGLAGIGIVEHAFHLYFPRSYAASFEWQKAYDRTAEVWAQPQRGRMANYRRFADSLRSSCVRIGLEVDLTDNGDLLLAPQDRTGWDYLIGGIHAIPDVQAGATSQREAEDRFLREFDRLLAHPIHILAHPFRFLEQRQYAPPERLYRPVAERLAARGVAAEINTHNRTPNVEFLRICLAHGVRLALGTDAHKLEEVAELVPHLQVLRNLGVEEEQFPDILFQPPSSSVPLR